MNIGFSKVNLCSTLGNNSMAFLWGFPYPGCCPFISQFSQPNCLISRERPRIQLLQGRGNDAIYIGYEMAALFLIVPIIFQNILHISLAKGSWIHAILNVLVLSKCSLVKNVVRCGDYIFQELSAYTFNSCVLCMISHDSFPELWGETMKINMIYQHILGTYHELEYSHFIFRLLFTLLPTLSPTIINSVKFT